MAKKKSVAGKRTVVKEEKKPTVIHTKRKEIVDKDGWTHVVDAPSRKPQGKVGKKKTASLLHTGDFEVHGVSYVNRTLDEMKTEFEYWKKGWEESSAYLELKKLLDEKKTVVSDVVFLGMGSLQSSRREGRRASGTQLAALQTMLQVLGHGKELKATLQDPQFTKLDDEFLTSLGYTVVQDPQAFKATGEKTLVYAVHCYADIYKKISEGPRPAMLVGTDVENFGRFSL